MTHLTINDLEDSRELDHDAMNNFLGGGLARSALFSLWPAPPGGRSSIPGVVNNYISNIFIETFQLNQLNQVIDITNSDNANVNQLGNTQNSNFKNLSANPAGFPALA